MAKTTYTGANVAPTTDKFSEWVDLTNRITYDMSDVVITVADVSQPSGTNHAETTGNGHVNVYFSSNYLQKLEFITKIAILVPRVHYEFLYSLGI